MIISTRIRNLSDFLSLFFMWKGSDVNVLIRKRGERLIGKYESR